MSKKGIGYNNTIGTKKDRIRRTLFILSFTIIPVIHFLILYVYVNLDAFFMAFMNVKNGQQYFTGLDNFKWIFTKFQQSQEMADVLPASENLLIAVRNTFITYGVSIVMFPIGLFVGYFLYKKILGYAIFRVIFYLPSILSSVVISFFYIQLNNPGTFFTVGFGELFGVENLERFAPLYDSDYSNYIILFEKVWLGFPSNMILWGGALSRIPDSVIESAKLDGASWICELFKIILPLIWPTFVLLITSSLAGIFGATGNVFLLTEGAYNTQTLSNWIYQKVLSVSSNPKYASTLYYVSAMGLMMTIISCGIALFVRFFLNKKINDIEY